MKRRSGSGHHANTEDREATHVVRGDNPLMCLQLKTLLVAFCVMTTGFNICDYLTGFATSWWMTELRCLSMEGAKRQSGLLETDGEHVRLMMVLKGKEVSGFADLHDPSTFSDFGEKRSRTT